MSYLIPKEVSEIWDYGLDNDMYAMKLCGAGSGGMFLGYRLDQSWKKSENLFGKKLIWL